MTATASKPGPLGPPDEQFWEKYSPHYEFPLSSVGSVAMHIGALVVFLGALWLLARMTVSDKTPVPMTEISVGGIGNEATPPGGGELLEGIERKDRPKDRLVPDAKLDQVPEAFKDFIPLPKPGKGGTSPIGGDQPGAGNKGDPTSSGNRGARWELNFTSENGRHYLNQLAAMKATVVVPYPPDWKTAKAFSDLAQEKPPARDFDLGKMPGLYFVDQEAASVGRLVQALGLDFAPPLFIAFFPKDVEEELAAKERAYAGRREGDIELTRFRVLIRDGKPSVTVIEQIAAKK